MARYYEDGKVYADLIRDKNRLKSQIAAPTDVLQIGKQSIETMEITDSVRVRYRDINDSFIVGHDVNGIIGNSGMDLGDRAGDMISYETGDDDEADIADTYWSAQTFTTVDGFELSHVELYLSRDDNPGSLTVNVKAVDGSNHPTGAALSSGVLRYDQIPLTIPNWVSVEMTPYDLEDTTTYAIELSAPDGVIGSESKHEFYDDAPGDKVDIWYKTTPTASNQEQAQTFTIGAVGTNEEHTISKIKVYLKKTGSPIGTLTFAIKATSSGTPTGADLSTGTIDATTITTSYVWYEINMSSYNLVDSTQYALVAYMSADGGSGSEYISWARVNSGAYSGGSNWYSNNLMSSWSNNSTIDLNFEVYGTTIGGSDKIIRWRFDGSSPSYAGGNSLTSTNSGTTWSSGSNDHLFKVRGGWTTVIDEINP